MTAWAIPFLQPESQAFADDTTQGWLVRQADSYPAAFEKTDESPDAHIRTTDDFCRFGIEFASEYFLRFVHIYLRIDSGDSLILFP